MKFFTQCVLIFVFSATAWAGEKVDETINVGKESAIVIELKSETFTLTGWDKSSFSVKGELNDNADGYQLVYHQDGRAFFSVASKSSFFGGSNNSEGGNLTFFVPTNGQISIHSVNGDATIKNIGGSLELSIVNGEVTIREVKNRIQLTTVNGGINAKKLSGRMSISTVNGSINLSDSTGEVQASTVNGDLIINANIDRLNMNTVNGTASFNSPSVNYIKAESVNGRVQINTLVNGNGDITLSSVSGTIELALDKKSSAKINVNTMGHIENELSKDRPNKDNFGPKKWLNTALGEGEAKVNITSVSGSVSLKQLN